jgi:hypothetical protein
MAIELIEKSISILEPKGVQRVQITIDEDINLSEMKPDIDRILQNAIRLKIDEASVGNDKISILGVLKCNILYVPLNDSKPIHNIWSMIEFDEVVNMEGVSKGDSVDLELGIEDIRVRVINSRKMNVKAIILLKVTANENKAVRFTSDISKTDLEKQYSSITLSQLGISKKESYKIKDELAIPAGKPNIMELLWHDVSIQNSEIKLIEDKVNFKGTLCVAALYLGENAESSLEFVENELSFNGLINAEGCKEDMISDVNIGILEDNIQIRPDIDGEERVLLVEVATELDLKLYNEEKVDILTDVYSLEKDIAIDKDNVSYQQLLCKNESQVMIKESISMLEEEPDVMQIYFANGDVNVDNYDITEDSLNVEGTLFCKVMYVAADDSSPINVYETTIPFEHTLRINDINENSRISIRPYINQIGCAMAGEREFEIKCLVNIDATVFDEKDVSVIVNAEENELDYGKLHELPGIVGYIVKENDDLWYIAKKYKTKVESIKQLNSLDSYEIKRGDKLIVMKELVSDQV